MPPEDFKGFIKNAKIDYKKIGHVECPAFRGEKIYFNQDGFKHLVRKGKYVRPIPEQLRRIKLIQYVSSILKNSSQFQSKKIKLIGASVAYFWTFSKTVNSIEIRVIIRQVDSGKKHFFSVMDEKV